MWHKKTDPDIHKIYSPHNLTLFVEEWLNKITTVLCYFTFVSVFVLFKTLFIFAKYKTLLCSRRICKVTPINVKS
jgi:hypothetical protein